jgi:hypothetical protein
MMARSSIVVFFSSSIKLLFSSHFGPRLQIRYIISPLGRKYPVDKFPSATSEGLGEVEFD